jgi:hypothetical protein
VGSVGRDSFLDTDGSALNSFGRSGSNFANNYRGPPKGHLRHLKEKIFFLHPKVGGKYYRRASKE